MKLKRLAQVAIIGCGILALAACSSARKNTGGDDASMNDMNGGAQAMGVNDNSAFGSNMGSEAASRKNTYYFDYDRSNVREQDKPGIYANADYLIAHPNARVVVEGHTDPRGSREYNVALGEHRANAVAELLRSKGVGPSQIRVVSYGAERLAAPGRSESDYQLDRRAVIVYTRK
jgi:peptidoglycan-associated lipoprotein